MVPSRFSKKTRVPLFRPFTARRQGLLRLFSSQRLNMTRSASFRPSAMYLRMFFRYISKVEASTRSMICASAQLSGFSAL